MTTALSGQEISQQIGERFPDAVLQSDEMAVVLRGESLPEVARFLKTTLGLEFDYLASISGVDYLDYLEVVYHLTSMRNNHSLVLKVRCWDRDRPSLPSVVSLWRGADLQEREVYDLVGISFSGHPNLKRILLWEGFEGHPLRRDYL
jgi:NADH-quinone oxidoreductase subunit C